MIALQYFSHCIDTRAFLEYTSVRREYDTRDFSKLDAARRRVQAAYDPELLRTAGHRLVELLADHLGAVEAAAGDVLPWRHPAENIRLAAELLRQATSSDGGPRGVGRAVRPAGADHARSGP